jgi:hypothetical protein
MPAYLVRTTEDHDLVGFFVAEEVDELIDLIDEGTDLGVCEYLELASRGLYWNDPVVPVPIKVDENDQAEAEIPWSKADMTWNWSEAVYSIIGDDERVWTPLIPGEPKTPKPTLPPTRRTGLVVPIRRRR